MHLRRETAIVEGAVILEYLEETRGPPPHPSDPVKRAEHGRGSIGSAIVSDVAGFYSAPDEAAFSATVEALARGWSVSSGALGDGPYFAGGAFCR